MNIQDLLGGAPGLHFMLVEHESDCPGAHNNGEGCTCSPTMRMASKSEFIGATAASRKARRAAERAVAKAAAKAKRSAA